MIWILEIIIHTIYLSSYLHALFIGNKLFIHTSMSSYHNFKDLTNIILLIFKYGLWAHWNWNINKKDMFIILYWKNTLDLAYVEFLNSF